MPPQGLLDLPEELILYVVGAACEGEPVASIHKLLFVNRQFSRLVLPFLYHNLSYNGHSRNASIALQKLVITLLFDPAKAELVHSFQVKHGEVFNNDTRLGDRDAKLEEYGYMTEKRAEIQRIVDIMEEHGGSDKVAARWRKDFMEDPLVGAFFALMLARLPNLRKLTLLHCYYSIWRIFEDVTDGLAAASKDPSTRLPPPFAQVEDVTLGGDAAKYPHSPKPLTLITRWPSVTHVCGMQVGDGDNGHQVDPDPWFLDLKLRSTNITSVIFADASKLLSEHLVRFLGTAKALETFSYMMGHAWAWIPISTPELGRALDQHKDTLRELRLHYYDALELTASEDSVFAPMGFASYSTLIHLSISYYFLFGFIDWDTPPDAAAAQKHIVGALPASLRTLAIVQCEEEGAMKAATTAISAVLAWKKEKWPDLEKVVVAAVDTGCTYVEKMRLEIEAEGKVFGVSYTLTAEAEAT